MDRGGAPQGQCRAPAVRDSTRPAEAAEGRRHAGRACRPRGLACGTVSASHRASSRLEPGHVSRRSRPPKPGRLRRARRGVSAAACRSPPARRAGCWRLAKRHTELVRRLTPRNQLEQVLLDHGGTDPVLLERPPRLIALPARLWPTSGVVSPDPRRRLVPAGTLLPAGWRDAGPGWGGTAGGRRGARLGDQGPGPGPRH